LKTGRPRPSETAKIDLEVVLTKESSENRGRTKKSRWIGGFSEVPIGRVTGPPGSDPALSPWFMTFFIAPFFSLSGVYFAVFEL
jgi:hypothetical protein